MSFKNIIQAIPLSTFASASLSSSYQAVNSSGFPYPILSLKITNDGTTNITVSFDGTTDNFLVLDGEIFTINGNQYSSETPDAFKHPKGRIIYIKGTAGTGNIYLSGTYLATN